MASPATVPPAYDARGTQDTAPFPGHKCACTAQSVQSLRAHGQSSWDARVPPRGPMASPQLSMSFTSKPSLTWQRACCWPRRPRRRQAGDTQGCRAGTQASFCLSFQYHTDSEGTLSLRKGLHGNCRVGVCVCARVRVHRHARVLIYG